MPNHNNRPYLVLVLTPVNRKYIEISLSSLENKYWRWCPCLLYTSDAADEGLGVDLGGRRIIKKKKRGEGWREGVGGGARRQSGSERLFCFFFQAEDGIRDLVRSRGLGDVYKRQAQPSIN